MWDSVGHPRSVAGWRGPEGRYVSPASRSPGHSCVERQVEMTGLRALVQGGPPSTACSGQLVWWPDWPPHA